MMSAFYYSQCLRDKDRDADIDAILNDFDESFSEEYPDLWHTPEYERAYNSLLSISTYLSTIETSYFNKSTGNMNYLYFLAYDKDNGLLFIDDYNE